MKKKKIAIYSVIAIILLVIAIAIFVNGRNQPEFVDNKTTTTYSDILFDYEVSRYKTGAEITDAYSPDKNVTLGVVVDPWDIRFGSIPSGDNTGTRFISLENLKEKESKVNFKVSGDISPFVEFSKNDFVIKPMEKTTVEANFHTDSLKIGNYSGEIDVIIKTPKYDFLYIFWGD